MILREALKPLATDLDSIDRLAPSLRLFSLAHLPELRVVHFRNKSVVNSSRKFHQPIIFTCEQGFVAAPIKVTNRLKRLVPSTSFSILIPFLIVLRSFLRLARILFGRSIAVCSSPELAPSIASSSSLSPSRTRLALTLARLPSTSSFHTR